MDDARSVVTLLNALEEHEDVQSVTPNSSISDEILEAVLAEQS
jgi:hypothetical protein